MRESAALQPVSAVPRSRGGRRGFTLVEVLITIGIIALLTALALPVILYAKKKAVETRIKYDLQSIGQELEAYKNDFDGQYPVFADPLSDQDSVNIKGNGTWLDYQQCRGAVLLCRALAGPGPAGTNTNPVNGQNYANPGDDGADGAGFRVRRIPVLNGNTYSLSGKVYGPYVDAKFSIQTLHIESLPTADPNYPLAYPVLFDTNCGDWTYGGITYHGSPILYFPSTASHQLSSAGSGDQQNNLGYVIPRTFTMGQGAPPRFNGFDNQLFLDSLGGTSSFSTESAFATLGASCGSADYLLWTAGADGQFGYGNNPATASPATAGPGLRSDDIANFELPANLRKR